MAGERDPEDESWRDEGIIAAIRNGKPLGSFQRARLLDMLAAPSPEPLPLDVERLARALGNWCRYRSESCDEPSPCSHNWSLARTLFRDMAEPREPAP